MQHAGKRTLSSHTKILTHNDVHNHECIAFALTETPILRKHFRCVVFRDLFSLHKPTVTEQIPTCARTSRSLESPVHGPYASRLLGDLFFDCGLRSLLAAPPALASPDFQGIEFPHQFRLQTIRAWRLFRPCARELRPAHVDVPIVAVQA